jgi:hypothetical protein
MSNTTASNVTAHLPTPDHECRVRAHAYLVELIGARSYTLTWDSTHRLQGHVRMGGSDLVVIAARDASHHPIVLSGPSWDAVRRCPGPQRRGLVASCAITDRAALVSALESDEQALSALAA